MGIRLDRLRHRKSKTSVTPCSNSTAISVSPCGTTSGMERSEEGLKHALENRSRDRAEVRDTVFVPGSASSFNKTLELGHARRTTSSRLASSWRVTPLHRDESAGGHFRAEHQTPEGEALRNDDDFAYVAAWEWKGEGKPHELNKEHLVFENVKLTQRSYK